MAKYLSQFASHNVRPNLWYTFDSATLGRLGCWRSVVKKSSAVKHNETSHYCPRPRNVITTVQLELTWGRQLHYNRCIVWLPTCDGRCCSSCWCWMWMRRSHHSRNVINWSRPTPEASFINTLTTTAASAHGVIVLLTVSNTDDCHNRNKLLALLQLIFFLLCILPANRRPYLLLHDSLIFIQSRFAYINRRPTLGRLIYIDAHAVVPQLGCAIYSAHIHLLQFTFTSASNLAHIFLLYNAVMLLLRCAQSRHIGEQWTVRQLFLYHSYRP